MKTLSGSLFAVVCVFRFAAVAAPPAEMSPGDWAGIVEAHHAWQQSFHEVPGGYGMRRPGEGWGVSFDDRGLTAASDDGAWKWGLELSAWGFPESLRTAGSGAACEFNPEGTRLTRTWGDGLQEWYVNDARGIEHGFTIWQRPPGQESGDPLFIDLTVREQMEACLEEGSDGVVFSDNAQKAVLTYRGLKAWDADGRELAAEMTLPRADCVRFEISEAGARYPLTVDPVAAPIYMKAFNPGGGDRFGTAVAISGDTVVVGAHLEDGNGIGVNPPDNNLLGETGAAYVFVKTAGVWAQQAYLKGTGTSAGDFFGRSVAISGDTIVVGAYFEDSSSTGVNGIADNNSEQAGAAYVFVRNAGVWSQQAYLKASNTGGNDQFGWSVAASGDTVAVGAYLEDGGGTGANPPSNEGAQGSGAVYVYVRSGGTWTQQAYLKALNPGVDDNLGYSLALSGNTLVAGAYLEDGGGAGVNPPVNEGNGDSGAAYVFVRSGVTWTQQAYLKAFNTGPNDRFGYSVSVSGNTVVVGADGEDGTGVGVNPAQNNGGFDCGAAYAFVRNGTVWSQQAYLKASNPQTNDLFGRSVGVSGDLIVCGAEGEDGSGQRYNPPINEGIGGSGAAYTYLRTGAVWALQNYVKATNTGPDDLFGFSVAVSGDTVVVGAPDEDGAGTGINPPDSIFLAAAGGAYLYSGLGPLMDQDFDGLPDVFEIYFGTMTQINNPLPVTLSFSAGQFHMRWPEAVTTGVTVIPQWSPDLVTWLASGETRNGVPARTITVSSAGGNLKEAVLSGAGLTRAFMRLRLTCP